MKTGINKATLIGYVARDPESIETRSGSTIAKTAVATSTYAGKDRDNRTDFHNIVCFGQTASFLSSYVGKGDEVYVEGEIQNSSYEDKDGNKRYKTEIVVKDLKIVGKAKGRDEQKAQEEDDVPF